MTDYRQQTRDAIASRQKYDVFAAYRQQDRHIAKELFQLFDQFGITYSIPADEKEANKLYNNSLRPTPVRDSYFFLLISEEGTMDDDEIQSFLYHAALLNKKPIVLKRQADAPYPGFLWTEETKEEVFQEVAYLIKNSEREAEWIYGTRRT